MKYKVFMQSYIDMRCHGNSSCDDGTDFSCDTMVKDICGVVNKLTEMDDLTSLQFVMIGHSFGGAIAGTYIYIYIMTIYVVH